MAPGSSRAAGAARRGEGRGAKSLRAARVSGREGERVGDRRGARVLTNLIGATCGGERKRRTRVERERGVVAVVSVVRWASWAGPALAN